ncbi:MFS transporter [Alysiella filiformis]|uniref:Predicted arabinose efflux permease, MFS family n=1 Tax=Alysiella filiformis DSM 16848 TaxID=1120981 RepID=A0A286EJW6_9NEIS|nr:MFS transporter [Alysiella filiformis]QMT30695.1 MFS transporter [Alysiella filiformis]UBQ56325.1 MFS transporter [Alysiella filiformis DSM 16848]SOD71230.1 Predicted arabinose efflux permease, MFS family [Alysiella filiformis DSM 16848]
MARKAKIAMLPHEWRASTSLAGVYALRMLGMFLVLPVLALHAHGLAAHLPESEQLKMVGLSMAMYGLTQALLQLPLGILSDKIGRKKVIYLGMAVFAGGSFLAASATQVETLVIARAIQGAGAVSAAVTALVADLTREEVRTRAMSMIGLSIGLTFSVGLVLSPILTRWVGVDGLFVIMGALSAASIALVAFYTPNPEKSRLHQDAQAQTSRIGEVLKNTQLLRLNFGIFVLQTGLMAIFTALPFALRQLGLDKTEHWQVYLPATVIGLILMIPAIVIGETRNKLKQVFVLGIALVLLAQFALIFSLHAIWLIAAVLIVYFIGFNILEASMPSLVSKIAPVDLKGTAMGVYNTLQSIGVFMGGMLGSRMYAHFGFVGVFGFCCVIVAVWLLVALTAPAPQPVKNIMFALPQAWHSRLDELSGSLKNVAGVESVSFSEDKNTIFIKALQIGFDEEQVKQILTGV